MVPHEASENAQRLSQGGMAGSFNAPPINLECALEALEAARDHLLVAMRGLAGYEWSDNELQGRRLPAPRIEIERIALEVSLILDLLELEFHD